MLDDKLDFLFKEVKYYGFNDYAGMFFVKEVCERLDDLENYSKLLKGQINSIDDLYRFLWILSFQEMVKDIDHYNIEKETKERITKLSKQICLNHSFAIKYINNNYLSVFDKSNHDKQRWIDFFSSFIKLCYGKYSKGIHENVFLFFEKNYPLNILASFEDCSKYYSKHREGFKRLFDGLKQTNFLDDQVYVRFLMNYPNKKDSFLSEQAALICERTICEVNKMNLNEDNQEILYIQSYLQEYGKLATLYQIKCVHEYNSLKKRVRLILDSFIKKHGVHYRAGPIDLMPAIEILRKSKDKYKFFGLTHHQTVDGKIENILNEIVSETNKKNPLSEVMNDISRNRSNKYPYFKQDSMSMNMLIKAGLTSRIISDEQLVSEFANFIYNISIQIQEKYFFNVINIEKEITGQYDCLAALVDLARHEQFDTPYAKALIYSTSLSICTTIEKILRNIALLEIKNDRYVDINKATLGDLLSDAFDLKDVSKGLKYYLEFYLIKEVRFSGLDMERPGLNIRNNLMHGEDDAYESTDYGICLNLFYFLLSLLNDLALAMGEQDNEDI